MTFSKSSFIALVALSLAACAPKAPPELLGARQAYQHASTSDAARLAPAELHVASEALAAAEASFEKHPKDYMTIDLAYLAHRKAQMAEATAAADKAKDDAAIAAKALSVEQTAQLATAKGQLAASEGALSTSAGALAASEGQLAASQGELALSKEQLAASEAGRLAAMASLAKLAAVQEEERGMVITLSGSVLFTSGESTLMPSAQTKLDQVAQALVSVKERPMVVEGHTDSNGTDADNMALSQRRAEAVRSYLVQRGCDPALTTAQGIGESRPVAENDTPEGRANNRRVEIVVQRATTN